MAFPKRVLLWSPKGAGLHYGGAGMNAYRLYSSDKERKADVSLVHGYREQETLAPFREQIFLSDLTRSPLSHAEFLFRSRRWLRENAKRFDVFHGLQGFQLTVDAALQAKKHGLPAVVKLVSHRSDLVEKPGLKALLGLPERRRKAIIQVDALIAISEAIAAELLEYGIPEDKIARIPNGVDTDRFYPPSVAERHRLREHFGWPDLPTLLFVGSLVRRKNPGLLIQAIHELKKRGRDVHLVLAGPEGKANYAQQLRELVNRFALSAQVTFLGHTNEIASVYRAADVFALPSENEGMPNSLLEAMASGLASVCTMISGTVDLVHDGREGRLVPSRLDPFVEAIREYLDVPDLCTAHGIAARKKIEAQFSTQVVLAQHLELFRKITNG